MVIWLIGLSGAGKTSIGREMTRILRQRRASVAFLDGDMIREVMGNDLGYTVHDRAVNAGRTSRLCRYLDSQGIDVVCATLSNQPDVQRWNRANVPQYFEVYIRVAMDVLMARDSKEIYRRARAGELKNVVGVDIPFTPPPNPNLVVDNETPRDSFGDLAARIIAAIPWEREDAPVRT